jgi:hypothetical protein
MDFFENGLFGESSEFQDDANAYQQKIAEEALVLRSKIRSVFSTADGKDVSNFLINTLCNCSNTPWSNDALVMARNAGVQAVGLYLKRILESED